MLGQALVHLAVAAAAAGAVIAGVAAWRSSRDGLQWSRWLAYGSALALVGATAVMEYALVAKDFSISYAAEVGSLSTPAIIAVVSLWSALDGSILFWAVVLALYTAIFAWRTKDGSVVLGGWGLSLLFATQIFFGALVVGVASPFSPVSPVPVDGPGPNALLQNHVLMAIHPPTLYLGYVGMAVPAAMAAAALIAGRLDAAWMRSLRAWTLWVWAFMTLGILLGGWWSYEILGWGGYWAWDPVENASFMPWLTLTAALHSLIVTSRRRTFQSWTLVLVLSSFLLSLLGTFMTRSGVFNSVHSFTQSAIGPVFLGFIAVVLIGSLVLLSARIDKVETGEARRFRLISREAGFLLVNLVFTVFTFTVLFGTLYPLINQAITGAQVSVGEPYYDKVSLPIVIALLLLMGVGPALPWGRTTPAQAVRQLLPGVGAGLALGLISVPLGAQGFWVPFTWGLAGFILLTSGRELVAPLVARVRNTDESPPVAVLNAVVRSRRRVGAHMAHIGVAIAAVAIAASSSHKLEEELTIPEGETVVWQGWELTYAGTVSVDQGFRLSQRAHFDIARDGRSKGRLEPSLNHYRTMSQALGTPAIRTAFDQDLYLSVVRIDTARDEVTVRAFIEPMLLWLWVGGLLMFAGGLVAAWPRVPKRRERPPAKAEDVA